MQVDPAGGLAVESGVLSLPASGASPGTYPKVTVDVRGRVMAGANLAAADLPEHTHSHSDIVSGELPHKVQYNSADVGTRRAINLVEGTRVTLSAAGRVNVVVNAEPPVAGEITNTSPRTARGSLHPSHRLRPTPNHQRPARESWRSTPRTSPRGHLGQERWLLPRHIERHHRAGRQPSSRRDHRRHHHACHPSAGAGIADGSTYIFYVWARNPSGIRKVSLAIVNHAYAAYLAGPTQVTLTTAWQFLKIVGTLASCQTGLWIVVRQFSGNNDDWTTGDIQFWGAYVQQGDDPQAAYARTWASQTLYLGSGIAAGATVVTAQDSTTLPVKIHGPGSNLADSTLLELTANGELILAGGSGNGHRFAELAAANNPSGWAGVLRVKTASVATFGYILLYSSP